MEKIRWILIRGLARGNFHWGKFPEIFQSKAQEMDLELLEIPGNGDSFDEISPTNPHHLIESLRQKSHFIRQGKSVRLCGVSLGAMVALKWAELYPNEIESVTVINSSLRQCSSMFQRLMPNNYFSLIKSILTKDLAQRERIILQSTSNSKPNYMEVLNSFSDFARTHPVRFSNLLRQLWLAQRIVLNPPLEPSIKIVVSQKDAFVDPECSFAISKLLKAPIYIHPWAGHDLPLDDPDWLCSTLLV